MLGVGITDYKASVLVVTPPINIGMSFVALLDSSLDGGGDGGLSSL